MSLVLRRRVIKNGNGKAALLVQAFGLVSYYVPIKNNMTGILQEII
ncbi:hypothetical protein [Paenibacillus pini]|nr:hypothetical protein [Paenibacillus pini]